MPLIEPGEQLQILLLKRTPQLRWWIEIEDSRLFGAQDRSLKCWRHKSAGPVHRSVNGMTGRIGQHKIRRQVLILAAKTIGDPASQRRATRDGGNSTVKIANGNFVTVVTGMHRSNDTEIIHDSRGMWQEFGDFCAALPVRAEFPRTAEQLFAGSIHEAEDHFAAVVLPMMFGQFRLGIQQVHMSRSPMHEHRNHRVGARSKLRLPPLQIVRLIVFRLTRGRSQQTLVAQ